MNTENPQPSGADRLPETETRPALPPLDDDRVAVMEDHVFTAIEGERAASVRRSGLP